MKSKKKFPLDNNHPIITSDTINQGFLPLDISRCSNEKCNRKTSCARYLDKMVDGTYWFNSYDENNCEDYIKK